jgi:hypothetical protein
MEVPDILAQRQDLGVTLAPGGQGVLRVSPPGVLPSHLTEVLKAYKADILKLITAPPADCLSEEPCAICGLMNAGSGWMGDCSAVCVSFLSSLR